MSGSSRSELHSTIPPKMNHVAERAPQGWQTEHELSADSDTSFAVSNEMPCFDSFKMLFAGSHSNLDDILREGALV